MSKQKELLVEWLEDFKSKLGEYNEASEIISECENTLDKYISVVEPLRVPLLIQNARNARQKDGSCLEYGLEYHLNKMNNALEKGIPNNPARNNEWIDSQMKCKDLLVEWLESFKSNYSQYSESYKTIEECEDTLKKYNEVVESVRIPLAIQNARNARCKDGSCLEYGLDYHLNNFNSAVCVH